MPTYSISAPDGNTYKIEGPAGASQEQVQAEVLRQNPNAGKPPEKGICTLKVLRIFNILLKAYL